MTAEELLACKIRAKEIARLKAQIASMEQSAARTSDAKSHAALLQAQSLLADTLLAHENAAKRVERALRLLKPHQALLLKLRYVDGQKWKDVAKTLGYSEKHVYAVHKEALRQLSAIAT